MLHWSNGGKGLMYNRFKKKWRILEICSKEEQKNGVGV